MTAERAALLTLIGVALGVAVVTWGAACLLG
jgi:hypothetical protein